MATAEHTQTRAHSTLQKTVLDQFRQITRAYALFHITFFLIGFVELFLFLFFFSFFAKSSMLAFSLAAIFLTGFSYFVLLFYFQAKKPEQFHLLLQNYMQGSKAAHEDILQSLSQLVSLLQGQEHHYYPLPESFKTLAPLMEKFSIWTHWKDVHQMKELLLSSAIRESRELIKALPTDVNAHRALGIAYIALSRIYMDPRRETPDVLWVSPEYQSKEMEEKFQTAAQRAVSELKIIEEYAPNDTWVHAQLAVLYRDLKLPVLEIQEYETLAKMTNNDKEILFRLGLLYFEHGLNTKGLRIYEILKKSAHPQADALISFYDAFASI